MDTKKISIIIPTFNAAHQLAECLESIVTQSYENLEILIVDGGSADGTLNIAQNFARQFNRVRCISEPDGGIYDAMNKGMHLSSGDWIYFIGSDDQLHSRDTIEAVSNHFSSDVDFLYGDILRMTNNTIEGEEFDRDKLFGRTICHQAIFYRRDLLDRVGQYNVEYRICADWDLNIRCYAAGCRHKYIPITICNYAGAGLSSQTVDHVFHGKRFQEIERVYGVSIWNEVFRSSRHEFFHEAVRRARDQELRTALRYFLLYLHHGALAKLEFIRKGPGS